MKIAKKRTDKEDVLFILLGATGDLTKRKILPAIYRLIKEKKISRFAIIGSARSPLTAKEMLDPAKSHLPKIEQKTWKRIEKASYYHPLNFYNHDDYKILKKKVRQIIKTHRLSDNKIFYLATLPEHFNIITKNLARTGLSKGGGWTRIVYEKPFGSDLNSAKRINKSLARVFKEEQVFRIDHYLGKEIVGNLAMLRFTNRVLEPLWNRNHIESVQILLIEKLGLEDRGNFYDRYGALKDVVQNHILQLMALTAMEMPKKLTGEFIREEKAKILKKIKVHKVLRGQYEGYLQEKGVKDNSSTETFAALYLEVNNPRWRGVPFYLKTGKNLDKKETSIHIKFKPVHCLLENCPTDSNYLTIRIQPDEGFSLELFAKAPGKTSEVTTVKMDFCHRCLFKLRTLEAYQVLLEDVIKGEQSFFVRNDEIEYSWKIIKRIEQKKGQVYTYKIGSKGPPELEYFSKEQKMKWRE